MYPHLQYCAVTWGQAPKTTLKPIQTLQNKAIRSVANKPWNASTASLYHKMKMLKHQDIVKLQICKIMHAIHNGKLLNNYYTMSNIEAIHRYETRSNSNINYYQKSARTEKGKRAISWVGPKLWREIPSDMKQLSTNTFKVKLKQLLIDKYEQK